MVARRFKHALVPFAFIGACFCLPMEIAAQGRSLVFSDDFSGTSIDRSIWSLGIGPTNDNVHYYTDRADNAQVVGGELRIIARKESYLGYAYTSALLQTRNAVNWRYGRVEARIKLPAGAGFVPAFWMLPVDDRYGWWPHSGEIDIMEHPTTEIDKVYGSAHARAYSYFTGSAPKTKVIQVSDAESAFHVYAIEWSADQIDFYVDQTLYHTVVNDHSGPSAWPFDRPFYVILNLAVGGGWVGDPAPTTVSPAMMQVDYVRVYQSLNDIGIIGSDFPRTSETGVSYAVPQMSEATYTWSVPAGAQIASGQGTRQILVDWGKTGGTIDVTITTPAGTVSPTFPVVVSNNLLMNADLEKGVKYWNHKTFAPAQASFVLDSSAVPSGNHLLKGTVTTPGTNPWDAQITQTGFALQSGKQYGVRLLARADLAGRSISVSLINALTYSWYGGATLTLSESWKEYAFTVVPNQTSVGSFNIDIGAQAGAYSLDDLSLVDLSTQVGIEEQYGANVPDAPLLEQNFPNPFNPQTTIRYGLPHPARVVLAVFNTLGQQVAEIVNADQDPGYHDVVFDGRQLSSGVYLCRMRAGKYVETKKILLQR